MPAKKNNFDFVFQQSDRFRNKLPGVKTFLKGVKNIHWGVNSAQKGITNAQEVWKQLRQVSEGHAITHWGINSAPKGIANTRGCYLIDILIDFCLLEKTFFSVENYLFIEKIDRLSEDSRSITTKVFEDKAMKTSSSCLSSEVIFNHGDLGGPQWWPPINFLFFGSKSLAPAPEVEKILVLISDPKNFFSKFFFTCFGSFSDFYFLKKNFGVTP